MFALVVAVLLAANDSAPSVTPDPVLYWASGSGRSASVHLFKFWGASAVAEKDAEKKLLFLGSGGVANGSRTRVWSKDEPGDEGGVIKLWYAEYLLDAEIGEVFGALVSGTKIDRLRPISSKGATPATDIAVALGKLGFERSMADAGDEPSIQLWSAGPRCAVASVTIETLDELTRVVCREGSVLRFRDLSQTDSPPAPWPQWQLRVNGRRGYLFTSCDDGQGCERVLWFEGEDGRVHELRGHENIVTC